MERKDQIYTIVAVLILGALLFIGWNTIDSDDKTETEFIKTENGRTYAIGEVAYYTISADGSGHIYVRGSNMSSSSFQSYYVSAEEMQKLIRLT